MEFVDRLFQAIKDDNVKEFESCMGITHCGTVRLGRFPTLSVMYLYNSKRLLRLYEKNFLRNGTWQDIGEPMEISAKFRGVAGKCLRLYLNETVSPVEMLLLLNNNYKLRKVFSQARASAPVRGRLQEIYYIRWGLKAHFVRNKIVLQHRPLTRVEKLKWLMRVACVMVCVAIIVSMPFVIDTFAPFIPDDSGAVRVVKWQQINFHSDKVYSLTKDVTVPADFYAKQINCQLNGNGHTVKVSGNGLFEDINGKISNIVFETNGYPVAQNVTSKAEVDTVTVNVTVNMQTDKSIGFFANNNLGDITNVTVNVTGSLTGNVPQVGEGETEEDVKSYKCGGIVASNSYTQQGNAIKDGSLKNCTVNFNGFSLKGQLEADASFGGIVGHNDASIEGCTTNGTISADTFDVAGICSENNYVLVKCVNNANITQQTELAGWNPIATGIVLNNFYVVDQCENTGSIRSVSTAPALDDEHIPCAYASGIAYQSVISHQSNGHSSYSYVQYSTNSGDISASALQINASASGICSMSNGYVSMCVNSGKINADGGVLAEVAGVISLSYGYVYYSVNSGEIVVKCQQEAHVGGIVGTSYMRTVNCYSTGDIEVTGEVCYVGGILGYSMYEIGANWLYSGQVESCIVECEIKVTSTDANKISAVGGIVGRMENVYVENDYTGGHVCESYFIGKLQTASGIYTGAIVGAMGEKVYFMSKDAEEQGKEGDLHDNVYSSDCGADLAYGAVFSNGVANTYPDVGATMTSRAQAIDDAVYKDILKDLYENLNPSNRQ
ncbi:MAG: hypothetical protein J1G02_04830 [Clostridiales bacterium]|nr:hypothetical protein [Clostridiales bacterium]